MEEKKNIPRLDTIKNIVLVVFAVILAKILYLTTVKYQHYTELAQSKTYKNLTIEAPRGEIRDRYGRLLAGNKNQFAVKISGDSCLGESGIFCNVSKGDFLFAHNKTPLSIN